MTRHGLRRGCSMGDWTAEREASFRRMLALRFEAEAADQFDALARDMLSALDAERAARQAAERERDEAQAALVGLRESVLPCAICHGRGVYASRCDRCDDSTDDHECDATLYPCPAPACGDLRRALAATPAALAGQVRARVLREAAALLLREPHCGHAAEVLDELAAEAER